MCIFCKHNKALVETSTSQERQVAEDTALKMKLEQPFISNLKSMFNTIANDYETIYAATGQVLDIQNSYNDDSVALLRNNYRRVSNNFKGNLTDDIEEEGIDKIDIAIMLALSKYIKEHSISQAAFINKTTEQELQDLTKRSIINASLEGRFLDSQQIAQETKKEFKTRIPARVESIAMTETNNLAETTKLIEAQALAASSIVISGITAKGNMKKTWHTILDSKTRTAHAIADLQTVPINQAFTVGGEALMYPGDSRGSIGNIINCRCSLTYGVQR